MIYRLKRIVLNKWAVPAYIAFIIYYVLYCFIYFTAINPIRFVCLIEKATDTDMFFILVIFGLLYIVGWVFQCIMWIDSNK